MVSFKKKAKSWAIVTNPLNVLLARVDVAVERSEPNFSYSLRSFLLVPVGSMKTPMGMEPDHTASAAVLLLCSSQTILLPSYLGTLDSLFFCYLPLRKNTFSFPVIEEESGTILNLTQNQFRLISPLE